MLKNLFKADEVKVALVAGACIIIQAIMLKKVLHAEPDLLVSNVPVYLVIIYLIARGQKRESGTTKPLYWSVAIVLATILTILRHLV